MSNGCACKCNLDFLFELGVLLLQVIHFEPRRTYLYAPYNVMRTIFSFLFPAYVVSCQCLKGSAYVCGMRASALRHVCAEGIPSHGVGVCTLSDLAWEVNHCRSEPDATR